MPTASVEQCVAEQSGTDSGSREQLSLIGTQSEAGANNCDGFRLTRFEVLNWGTFHKQVWNIAPSGENALLTGDIGSGKSTLVDGFTTLLVPKPANQIIFNKAAGSEAKERTLSSYVKGEYKSEKDEVSAGARAISLRSEKDYSVLLARFDNKALKQSCCIAQLFYFKDKGGKVERLFILSSQELTISEHFGQFESIPQLKRRLRQQGCQLPDNLKEYARLMRRSLGINSERATDLFYQTVSMKSVDNLTQFVRRHMLDEGDNRKRVDTLCQAFEDLDRAHEAVIKARQQIASLTPLVGDGDKLRELEQQLQQQRQSRELLEAWRAEKELGLEQQRQTQLEEELNKKSQQLEQLQQNIQELRRRETSIENSLDDNGGRRLKEITLDIQRLEDELGRRRGYAGDYRRLAKPLSLPVPKNIEEFQHNLQQIDATSDSNSAQQEQLDGQRSELLVDERQLKAAIADLNREIGELAQHPSNIPANSRILRRHLCEALSLEESQLPFAGELIQVADKATIWEGAIERVLHNFGLSMLVPEALYQEVADHVDQTHLRGRLVYYRVATPRHSADPRELGLHSLVNKLELKNDSNCYDWLLAQLAKRFDYSCCENLTDFRRSPRAITLNGQIKSGGDRHEKDDRHTLQDRSRYILGWDNRSKLQTLRNKNQQQQQVLDGISEQLGTLKEEKSTLDQQQKSCSALTAIRNYSDIDWQGSSRQIDSLQQERRQIEESSDILRELQNKLVDAQKVRSDKEAKQQTLLQQQADINAKVTQSRKQCEDAAVIVNEIDIAERSQFFPILDQCYRQHFDSDLNLQNIRVRERELRSTLQRDIDADDKKRDRLRSSVEKQMADYCHDNNSETQEVDASIEALEDYRRMLNALTEDDLPRFESKFKQELNEKTIQSLVHFSTQLDRSESNLKGKIQRINQSLIHIEYNEGSYIQLMAEGINDGDIRQFRQDLRACLSDTLGEELYDESRFLQVKAIIERFRGREGFAEIDKRWTLKVTDVRNWFGFSAEELWRQDGTRRDYFESSSGKSGGQKEKLAYTVLASALAYQFGLDQSDNIRSYRFVVIDEAFGRGSESSTRYALRLFQHLGLQLLVVTPLQKIHVIEPYINHVHFVHIEQGKNSQLRNMTIEAYREEKQQREQQKLEATLEGMND